MNTIALQATVSAEPELHQQQTDQSRTSLMLQFPAHQSGEDDFTIRLVAFGGLADEIAESLHIGTAVIIEGRSCICVAQLPLCGISQGRFRDHGNN